MAGLSQEERDALLRRAADIGAELEGLPRSSLPLAKRASKLGLLGAELLELSRKLQAPEPPATR